MTDKHEHIDEVVTKLRAIRGLRYGSIEKPHKMLFLMTLARLYESDPNRPRIVPLDDSLTATFAAVSREFCGESANQILIEYPFYHLASDELWTLNVRPNKRKEFEEFISSPKMRLTHRRLVETVEGGELEESVDRCLREATGNATVQQFLSSRLEALCEAFYQSPSQVQETRAQYSLFAHEADALNAITRHIERHNLGVTLCNLELHDKQSNRYFEADLILVSRFGVYVVELKHWSGRIEVRPNSWLQNNSFFKPDPHKANNFKAKLLRGLYDRKFPSFPSLFFESVVVLTNPDVEASGCAIPKTDAHNPTFESIDRFLQYLKCQRQGKPDILSDSQCKAFADYVRKLHSVGAPRDFFFPGYEIVERLYQYEDRAEVVARRTDLRHRRLSRLRIFFLAAGDSRAREKATATLNAVEKIGEHPNILKVWDIPNENSFLVEGSDWSEMGTLRDCLDRSGPLQIDLAVSIGEGLAKGLEAAHSQCVVHRALSPDNILMVDDTPKLMNFDLSFQLEDNRVTVIPDASKLKRSPYIAPEIYVSGTVPEATADLFSLGVILFEMLVGSPPFGCSTDLERSGGRLSDEQVQRLHNVEGLSSKVIDLVHALIQQCPSDRITDASRVLKSLGVARETPTAPPPKETNPRLEDGSQSGIYNISSFVKTGAEAQIYRAAGVRGKCVALKLFNRDVPLPRIVDEQGFAATAHHPSLVRVDSYSQWEDGRYFIAFDWVSERSLRNAIDEGERPDREVFVRGAEQLMDAIGSLHQNSDDGIDRPILHNDIKPENILVADSGRLVLIDFGAASEPHIGTYEGTEGYVAPDLRLGKDRKYCADGDLYALSICLHEWLLGTRPGDGEESTYEVPAPLLGWLLRGCSAEASGRYPSVTEMRAALLDELSPTDRGDEEEETFEPSPEPAAPPEEKPRKPELLSPVHPPGRADPNPFVPYLNSLHSRTAASENALAESQACNPFFEYIHVKHPVAARVHQILTGSDKKHIILTGHAGDGKSTIAVDVFKRLSGLPADNSLEHPLQRREDIGAVSLIKDFSEWSPAERASLMGEMLEEEAPTFLLVSNTGTLLDAFRTQEQQSGGNWVAIESDLLSAMNALEPTTVAFHGAEFVLLNVAMMDNLPIAREILRRMLAPERWAPCESSTCKEKCPIFRNVALMRANLPLVRERLFLAYRRIYEYGTRLTLRQLCAHMAYMITSGLDYSDILKMAQRAKPPLMSEFMFFNRFFGDNGSVPDPLAAQLKSIKVVRDQSFGAQPCPTWERRLWLRSRGQSFVLRTQMAPEDFETLRQHGAGLILDNEISSSDARNQVRRAVFFLHDIKEDKEQGFLRAFLKSNMLLDFVRWQEQAGEMLSLQESNALHRRIVHVLQEHFTGVRLPEGASSDRHLFVTLNRHSHDVRQSAQVVLARYPEDDFRVVLHTLDNPAGGTRRELFFEGPTSGGISLTLPLSLPFLDYVMLRNRGEIGEVLQTSYVDRLERFKGQLIRHASGRRTDDIMLVRLRTNHTFRRQIFAVNEGRLEVTDA
jgi:serine/threonine protein kinase